MKTTRKLKGKLTLNKETIVQLDHSSMHSIKGGSDHISMNRACGGGDRPIKIKTKL